MLRKGWAAWQPVMTATLAVLCTAFSPALVQAKGSVPGAAVPVVSVSALPVQGRNMMTLIYQGGPFRYEKDGSVFGNRERILPAKNRSYYREYTVQTPGERSRGGRRIVCGGFVPTVPDACYYTDDHYASFRRIVP